MILIFYNSGFRIIKHIDNVAISIEPKFYALEAKQVQL